MIIIPFLTKHSALPRLQIHQRKQRKPIPARQITGLDMTFRLYPGSFPANSGCPIYAHQRRRVAEDQGSGCLVLGGPVRERVAGMRMAA